MIAPPRFTRADYERLAEGYPAQLVDGALVKEPSPTPWHEHLVIRLTEILLERVGRRRMLASPIDLVLDDEDVYQPDLVVFGEPVEFRPENRRIETPCLVIEILSESTAARDRGVKASRYLEVGVGEVWIVDPLERSIEIRTASGIEMMERGMVARSGVVPELSVDVEPLFRV